MMTLRIVKVASWIYLASVALTLLEASSNRVWPDLAVQYSAWAKAQYSAGPTLILAYFSAGLAVLSVTSMLALGCGVRRARHIAALSFGGVLICNCIIALLKAPPGIITPYENVLGDLSTISLAVALTAAYIDAAQQCIQSDGPASSGSAS